MENKTIVIACVVWNFHLGCKIHKKFYFSGTKLIREDIELSCPSPLEAKWVM